PTSGPASQDWSIPHNVRDLLRARLASAGETGWQLLTTAAVIGRSFDYNTLREASGRSEVETVAGLEALLAQGLVKEQAAGSEAAGERGSEISYDFSHDKLRALVLEETSRTRQRLLHLRVAEALAGQLHPPREGWARAGQIARHYHLSDQDPLAAEYFKLAGEHAQSVYANVDAMAFFQEALAAGHPQAAKLHEDIGDLHILAGEYSAALNRYQTASALAEAQALPGLEHKLGMVHHRRGELDLAVSYFQSALEALGESGEAGPRARLYADWSRTSHRQGQPRQAWELAGRAVELAEQAEDAAAQGQAHNILGILARNAQDWDQACAHLERSLSVARASGDMGMQAAALNNLALVYGDRGEPEQAIQFAQTALELCARQGDRHREAALHNNLADLYHAAGQAEQAMSHLKKAVVIFAEIGGEAGQMQSETWMLTEW
ncbi:MAG TPA: tetratricopeptide repeat protein, partial [Anaerolineales bacterium]